MEERICPFCSSSMIEYEGDLLYHCKTCGNYIAENEFESETPSKKLYFVDMDIFVDLKCTHTQLTDEEWIRHSEFVYDSIEEYCNDFNNECTPSDARYYVRYI